MPLYGHIQVKMALITHAYFEEGDFSKVSLLEETYYHLNTCMNGDSQMPLQVFIGIIVIIIYIITLFDIFVTYWTIVNDKIY